MRRAERLLILAIISCFMLNVPGCTPAEKSEFINGSITFINGKVLINGKEAQSDDLVRYGDSIEVKKGGRCRITFETLNIIDMSENCSLTFKIKKGDGLLDLRNGYIGAVLKNLKIVKEFRISTPTVIAGIRGTSLLVAAIDPQKTYSCVCNGRAEFSLPGGRTKKEVTASHHSAAYYTVKDGKSVELKVGMEYHTDADMENLASAIGVSIDWKKID